MFYSHSQRKIVFLKFFRSHKGLFVRSPYQIQGNERCFHGSVYRKKGANASLQKMDAGRTQ